MNNVQVTDVAILGAGIIGLSIAWQLQERGLCTALFDAGAIAAEASSAGAGMLAPGGEAKGSSAWERDTVTALSMYPSFVEELAERTGVDIDFRVCGAVDLAFDAERWAELEARRSVQEAMGIAVRELSASEIRECAPAICDTDCRALWYAGDAIVNPRTVTSALRLALLPKSTPLVAGVRISRCEREGNCVRFLDDRGETRGMARALVVAAGAWSSQIDLSDFPLEGSAPPRRALPIRGHLLRTSREPGLLGPIVRAGDLYVFHGNQGDVVVGSNEEHAGFERELNLPAVHRLHGTAERVLPGLVPRIETAWLGFRPGIEGDGPEVRRLGNNPIWLAYGHFRNGILLAPHTAERISTEIADDLG